MFEDFLTLWVVSKCWERAIEPLPTTPIAKATLERRFIFFARYVMIRVAGTLFGRPTNCVVAQTTNKRWREICQDTRQQATSLYNKKNRWEFILLAILFVEIAFGRLIPGADRDDAR